MQIMRDWQITLDQDEFMAEYGHTFTRVLRRPGMPEMFQDTFCEASELIEPVAIWNRFPVREMRHDTVILENGTRIGNGPVTTVMGGASELAIGVCTVGSPIMDRIHLHKESGAVVRSMLLDQLATLAVGQLSQRFYAWLKDDVSSRGLQISTYLSPGESEWSVKDQAVIFKLLDPSVIGVSLTETMLMKPIKSLSLMAGIGGQTMGVPGATHCDYCTMKERCPYHGKHGTI